MAKKRIIPISIRKKHSQKHLALKIIKPKKVRVKKYIEVGFSLNKKIIINNETGIFYKSIKDASKSRPLNEKTLRSYLYNVRTNKTSFLFC